MGRLRKLLFILAWVALIVVVLVEIGSNPRHTGDQPPGFGIPDMALVDGLLLYAVTNVGLSLIVPERLQGRLQGLVSLIVSSIIAVLSFKRFLIAYGWLMIMLTLLLAAPFGTLAYVALFGSFDRDGAGVTLSLIMFLKLAFAVLLMLANPRFLQNKSLVLLALFSFGVSLLTTFLHGFVPRVLVSITDALGGIVNAVIALVWAIFFLVFAIIAVVKALRFDRSGKQSEG